MTKNPPKISVCCALYNRSEHIIATIDSVLNQTYSDFEFIIVDDGSTDPKVRDILSSYKDSRIKVLHQKNSGFVRAISTAIELAQGEYIALQGAGDVSLPKRLEAQISVFEATPEVGVVGCRIKNIIMGGIYDGHQTEPNYKTLSPGLNDFLYEGNPISHGEVMYRKSIYVAVGGYRHFFKFAQDRDLWIRLSKRCKFQILDELLYHRHNFVLDGVSTNRKKLVVQQAMSHFARQCHFDRERDGQDYIDIYGEDAGLFRKKNKELAKKIAKQGLQALLAGDRTQAHELTLLSINEKKTLITLATFSVVQASLKSKTANFLTNTALRRLTKNSESWLARS